MLKFIEMKDVASYREDAQRLSDIKTVNIIYGDNGSGKSTLARCISNSENDKYCECKLAWENNIPLNAIIYDKFFVENTLAETNVKGVFTFGDGATAVLAEIDRKKEEVIRIAEERKKLEESNNKMKIVVQGANTNFEDYCWKLQKKYVDVFKPIFEGFRGSKAAFKDKTILHSDKQTSFDFDYLTKQTSALFVGSIEKLVLMPTIDSGLVQSIDSRDIYKLNIIGKEDVPIAKLIKKLGNGDWIRQGLSYFQDGVCPFCQQNTSTDFKNELEMFFDENYNRNIKTLEAAVAEYKETFNRILTELENMQDWKNIYFEYNMIKDKVFTAKSQFVTNCQMLDRKLSEPSFSANIMPMQPIFGDIDAVLNIINMQIIEFNNKIDNIKSEREALKDEVWAFIGSEARDAYDNYLKTTSPLKLSIRNDDTAASNLINKRNNLLSEILNLEKSNSSTRPVMHKMNSLLQSFGFDSFHIVEAETDGYYRIARLDGTVAAETLSEGERTFITFLYFYHLLQDNTASRENAFKVVVFDDPVSSLDSKILFVVSSMIRRLYNHNVLLEMKIKQIFIFTHNIYFHKEVSYLTNLKTLGPHALRERNFGFWVVKNRNNTSFIVGHEKNPIKSGYDLLWREVREATKTEEFNLSLCNTLRRILEYYFKHFGGISLDKLVEKFDGEEKIICRSLVSWIHDGSHFIPDGIDFGFQYDMASHYLPVFKKIFYTMHHEGHYDMMMNKDN